MSPLKGGPSAGTNATLPAGIQEGSSRALPFFGQVDPEDGRGIGDSQRVLEAVDQAVRGRRRRAGWAHHLRARGAEQAPPGEQDPQTGKGVPEKSCRLLCTGGRDSVSSYRLIEAEKTSFPVQFMCRMLGVSRSGYYGWRDKPPSARSLQDAALTEKIREIHERSRQTYGSPRVHAELKALGTRCSRKRVERLMREAGVRGCMRGRRGGTTRRGKRAPVEDLVKRNFAATEADRVWVADITYVATREGFLYLAFILDVHSRRI